MAEEIGILVKDKFCLTIEEASRYFGIGEKKLRRLVNSNLDTGFVIQSGVKILIKRQRFEQFLDNLLSI
jgi:excisionase family DNA binding protein